MVGSLVIGVAPSPGLIWSWSADLPYHVWVSGPHQRVAGFVLSFLSRHHEAGAYAEQAAARARAENVLTRSKTNIMHEYWFGKGA